MTTAGAAFRRLCVIGFLAYCSYAICRTPLLPLFARELGATPPMVGFIVGASTLTGILVKLPAGAWSDVLGRRPLLLLGTVVFATMPFTYLGVASLATLVALRFAHGSATAIFGPVASASVSDVAPPARRATWLSTYSTVQGLGQALGPIVGGYVIATGQYDAAFMVAGFLAASTPFIVSGWPASPVADRSQSPRRLDQFTTGIVEVAREPLILVTSLAQAAQFVLNGTLNAFLPLFAKDVIGLSSSQIGWLFALQTITTLVARPIMGMLSDRVGRRGVITAGLALCASAVVLVSFATALPALATAILLYAAGVAVTTAATSAFITDLSRRVRYGAAHGVFGTIYDVGDALGPILAGFLVATVGYGPMFRIMAGIALTVAVVFYLVSRGSSRPLHSVVDHGTSV
jgi:MFS transporter, DHA1 family, multidrug resistance protein